MRVLVAALALALAGVLVAQAPPAEANNQRGAAGCDATVRDGESIQAAIDDAEEGDTICVRGGTYDEGTHQEGEGVSLDKANVTVRGHTPAHSGNAAVIDGSVSLDADGTQLHRMAVTRSDDIEAPTNFDAFGIRVQASDTVVADNLVHSLTGESVAWHAINGIQVFGDNPIENIVIRDNTVTDIHNEAIGGAAGVKLQANLDHVMVTGNAVTDLHAAGWAWGVVLTSSQSHPSVPKDVVVEGNTMERLNDGSVYPVFEEGPNEGRGAPPWPGSAFGVDGDATADEVTSLEGNNLLAPNGAESKDEDNTLAARCNWWGDRSGPTHDDNPDGQGTWAYENPGEIDIDPWLNAPAPSRACR